MSIDIPENRTFCAELYEAVGHLVVWSGRLEYLLKLTIKSLLGQGFTAGMEVAESERNFKPICERAIVEVQKRKDAGTLEIVLADSLINILHKAIDLSEFRNDTVHAYWLQDQATFVLQRVRPEIDKTTKKLIWNKTQDVPLTAVRSKGQDFERLYWELDTARRKIP